MNVFTNRVGIAYMFPQTSTITKIILQQQCYPSHSPRN